MRSLMIVALAVSLVAAPVAASKDKEIGTNFPTDFPAIVDASLGTPVLGFGSGDGPVAHTPVIFLHGNTGSSCDPPADAARRVSFSRAGLPPAPAVGRELADWGTAVTTAETS